MLELPLGKFDLLGREMEDFMIDGEKSPVAFELKSSMFVFGSS